MFRRRHDRRWPGLLLGLATNPGRLDRTDFSEQHQPASPVELCRPGPTGPFSFATSIAYDRGVDLEVD